MTTWLIVEDEPDLIELFQAATEMIGIESLIFSSGEDAIHWIEDVENQRFDGEKPVLALIDIRLAGEVTGAAVGARVRECAQLSTMTLVLMTAHRLSPAWEKVILEQSGADLLLYKPLPAFKDLHRLLQSLLRP